jgi:hypothetical protein
MPAAGASKHPNANKIEGARFKFDFLAAFTNTQQLDGEAPRLSPRQTTRPAMSAGRSHEGPENLLTVSVLTQLV